MVPMSLQSHSDASQAKDFTRVLPFQLSMAILGLLDQKSLDACSAVSGHWQFLVQRVREDKECRSTVQKSLLQLQELCPRKTIPNYAKRVQVQIPQLNDEGEVIEVKDKEQKKRRKSKMEDFNLQEAYRELKTHKIELEERNVFCGPYKTCVLLEQSDRSRRAHYSGGDWVAAGSRRLRLLPVPGAEQEPLLLHSHAVPVTALCLREDEGLLLSSSGLELSIRCWDIRSGACVRNFTGHYATVSCLHSHREHFVSGAGDGTVKVWSLRSGKCLRTLLHSSPVQAVRMDGTHVVSAGHQGLVKVWSAETGALIKVSRIGGSPYLGEEGSSSSVEKCRESPDTPAPAEPFPHSQGSPLFPPGTTFQGPQRPQGGNISLSQTLEKHQGPVLCLSFDQWHLVTGSSDGYALGWSMLGKFRRCLVAFFHPKAVLSLQFLYLRVISGCADGRIRIFNFLTGTCLRVLEPTSSGDPVSALCVAGNRVVTNSPSRLLLLQFEDVAWDYSLPADREELKKDKRSRRGKRQGAGAEQQRARDKSLRSRQGPKSRGTPKSDEAEQGPASPAPEEAEATLECELPQRHPSCPMTPDRFLLTIGTLQSFCTPAPASRSPSLLSATAGAAPRPRPGQVPVSKAPQQHREEQAARLQRARLHSRSLALTKTSTPFETKTLRLRLKNSLHSPTVKSSIPAPCVVRPKPCGSPGERKTRAGHGKDTPGPKDGDRLINLWRAASEVIQPSPGTAAEMRTEAPRRTKPSCPHASRRDSGLRLLTAEQELREAAAAARQQAQQARPTEDKGRARRKAWLRKSKGLPVGSFTGERKTLAPELGHNTFI